MQQLRPIFLIQSNSKSMSLWAHHQYMEVCIIRITESKICKRPWWSSGTGLPTFYDTHWRMITCVCFATFPRCKSIHIYGEYLMEGSWVPNLWQFNGSPISVNWVDNMVGWFFSASQIVTISLIISLFLIWRGCPICHIWNFSVYPCFVLFFVCSQTTLSLHHVSVCVCVCFT